MEQSHYEEVPAHLADKIVAGLERHDAEEMISSQMPLDDKIKRAKHVVWNNGDRSVLAEQARLLAQLWRQ